MSQTHLSLRLFMHQVGRALQMLRGSRHGVRLPIFFVIFVALLFFPHISSAARQGFKPKPCLDCHKESLGAFNKKVVHPPMAVKNCEACGLTVLAAVMVK